MREHKKLHLGIIGWAMVLTGAMSLGSCASDETLESIEPKAIAFGGAAVENSSRATDPSYGQTTNPLDEFQVWGTVTGNAGTANIYSGATVTNTYVKDATKNYGYGQVWSCTQTQYWIPNATYNFVAIANATSVTTNTAGIPTAIDFTLTDGSKDLLYAQPVTVKTDGLAAPTTGVNENQCVPFAFTHLLSKVHFTFDGSASSVANIQVTGHYASGTYNISTAKWGSLTSAGTTALSFGGLDTQAKDNTSANARLIIPGEQTWNINLFDEKGNKIGNSLKLDYTAANDDRTSGGFKFEPNTQYNIIISLGVDLSLSVDVQGWDCEIIPNDFAKDVAVGANGHIVWNDVTPIYVNAEGNKIGEDETPVASWVVFDKTKTQATFTFTIDAPMGGTWNAMLVTKQGTSEVFQIVKVIKDENGVEIGEEVTDMGKVGETCTLRIKTISPNTFDIANMAELRIVVRQAGEILPAHRLMYHAEDHVLNGKNYIMVQNK